MNRFEKHHQRDISFSYSCFDRMILNGCIPWFLYPDGASRMASFLLRQRQAPELNRAYLAKIARDYHQWLEGQAQQSGIVIVEPPKGIRREAWVEPYFQQLGNRHGIAVILKPREIERMAVVTFKRLGFERRLVNVYYFYINDSTCGRMFLRICPYFPFSIQVWINGHNWLACRLRQEGIAYEKRDNLFVACAKPERLQELSDQFAPADIVQPVTRWLERLLPYFSAAEQERGYRHELYLTQIEYCHNLIFHKPAALERLFDRLMDANRGLGHPDKLAIIFARPCYQPDTRTGQVVLKMTKTRTPVLSGSYKSVGIKQYVSNGIGLRTESSCYQLKDLSLLKNVKNLPHVRKVMNRANQCCLDVQQDILTTYVDRGQLEQLRQPSVSPTGRRVPGLHIDDPRLLAVLQAVLCYAYLVGKGCFRTKDLLLDVQKTLAKPGYQLSQLRYDLSKLRGKGLLARLPGTQSYQLSSEGYRLGIFYLKLYQQVYAPLTAAITAPDPADHAILTRRQTKKDRLYTAVDEALQKLTDHLGIAIAA